MSGGAWVARGGAGCAGVAVGGAGGVLRDLEVGGRDDGEDGELGGAGGRGLGLAEVVVGVECVARHVAGADGVAEEERGVVAYSLGAVIAAAWVHDYAPRLCGMV